MSYAITRIKRLKDYNAVARTLAHNNRRGGFYGGNVDETQSHKNVVLLSSIESADDLKAFYKGLGVVERANSVRAVELVLTTSPDWWLSATNKEKNQWVATQLNFLKKEWGEKLKHAVLHLDEKTPHIQAICSVEEVKIHKYKNQKGEFLKEKCTLNAKRFDRKFLQEYQTRYAEANKKFGLIRGAKGSSATHKELKKYYKEVDIALNSDYSKEIDKKFDEFFKSKKIMFTNYVDIMMLKHL